jgi:hypothetical protein
MSGAEVDEVIAAAITAQAAEDESQRRADWMLRCANARQRSSRMFTFQKCSKFVIYSYSAAGTGPFPSTIKMVPFDFSSGPFWFSVCLGPCRQLA